MESMFTSVQLYWLKEEIWSVHTFVNPFSMGTGWTLYKVYMEVSECMERVKTKYMINHFKFLYMYTL